MELYHKIKKLPMTSMYAVALLATALTHVGYAILSYFIQSPFFIIYNICSVMLHLYVSKAILKGKYVYQCFFVTFLEINIFTNIGQIMLGNDFGFGFILFGVFMLQFYLMYTCSHDISAIVKFNVMSMLSFIVCNIASTTDMIPKVSTDTATLLFFYYYNMFCGGVAMTAGFLLFMCQSCIDNERLRMKNEELQNVANYDELTKLLNRRSYDFYMNEFFNAATCGGEDFCVMIFDIDNFKHINDTYGHPNGDIVLKNVAKTFTKTIRPHDVAFRWGGEEFLIVSKGGKQAGSIVAERCRSAISDLEFEFNGETIKVTATVGLCPYRVGITKDIIVDKADAALYKGKTTGKNKVVISNA